MDFQQITWVDSTGTSNTTSKENFKISTEDGFKILIPDEVLLRSFSIDFGQNRRICEVIVAGINAGDYKCPIGTFFSLMPMQLQCAPCSKGQYGDEKGLIGSCKTCKENERPELVGKGSTKCTPCEYLKFSTEGSSTCQQCNLTSLTNPACPLNPYTGNRTKNIVSETLGSPELRSFVRDQSGDFEIAETVDIPLVSENKPFYIYSAVLMFDGEDSAIDTLKISSCEKSTSLNVYPTRTDVFKCQESGVESLTLQIDQTVRLQKVFVFGIPFREAPAPPGKRNTGTQFEECAPGAYSLGGQVTECTKCKANQEQPARGQTSCNNCREGYYSAAGDASCKKCNLDILHPICKRPVTSASCKHDQENDPKYGNYSWPTTAPGDHAEMNCFYNSDSMAYKQCDVTTGTFRKTDFRNCKSKVHEEISKIQEAAVNITNEEDQKEVSKEIKDLAEKNSEIMNSDDVKKTSEIIDILIDFDEENQKLDEEVRDNILKAVDGVHRFTDAEEIARDDVAPSMRNSVEKLTEKISKGSEDTSNEQVYVKEETVGVVVSKTTGDDNTFTVSGDETDLKKTELADNDQPVLFSVKVPANNVTSAVTAVLYKTPKFFPENDTVADFTVSLAEWFTDRTQNGKKPARKVVTMVTEIKYVDSTGRFEFEAGKMLEIKYTVKEEKACAHYRMPLEQSYECVFYNTKNETWVTGASSGCTKNEETGKNGEKLVSCQCDHMTSFAVLMSFDSDYDPLEATVTTILLGISLGCLFFTIIAYLPAKEMLRSPSRSVQINLLFVSSLMLSIIVFYFMELVVTNNVKDIQEKKILCEADSASLPCLIVASLMNYIWLCQMAWMVCEAVVLYRAIVKVFDIRITKRKLIKYNLACWGIPLIFPIVGIVWGRSDFVNPRTCFLRQEYGLVTFYIPVTVCIIFNFFVFLRISWSLFWKKSMDSGLQTSEMERIKRQFKIATSVMTILGVAWIFGFFLIIQELNVIWLRWLFIIFNSTQGIFIFLLYVVLNENLRKVWMKLLNISTSDKTTQSHSKSNVPSSRSKGLSTKQTFGTSNLASTAEMEHIYTSTASSSTRPKVGEVSEVSGIDQSAFCPEPSSSLITSSSAKPQTTVVYKANPGGVHIYDNFASIASGALEKRLAPSKY